MSHNSCKVKKLNLRLNTFGNQGAAFLLQALEKGAKTIKSLSISGCGITGRTSFGKILGNNKTLEELDISNNRIGEVRYFITEFLIF